MRMTVRTVLVAAVVLVVAATPAWAAAPSCDLQASADGLVGAVGSTKTVDVHLYNAGPNDAPAAAVLEEFHAPGGTHFVGVGTTTGLPAGCTGSDKDIKCVRAARLPQGTLATTRLTIMIDSIVTGPGQYKVSCYNGRCADPNTKNNSAPIVVNSVIHSGTPSTTPSGTPSATPTVTATVTASATATPTSTATPTKSPTPTPRRTTSPSPAPGPTVAGSSPDDAGGGTGAGTYSDPAVGLPSSPDSGGFGVTGMVWTVLGGTLVLAALAALLLMRRRPAAAADVDEDTDDLGGLLGS